MTLKQPARERRVVQTETKKNHLKLEPPLTSWLFFILLLNTQNQDKYSAILQNSLVCWNESLLRLLLHNPFLGWAVMCCGKAEQSFCLLFVPVLSKSTLISPGLPVGSVQLPSDDTLLTALQPSCAAHQGLQTAHLSHLLVLRLILGFSC